MEMHEIRYFLAACQTLNFRRAADLAHVTQPALTRAIQKLEAELGGLLFHRDKGHVQLSDFGRLMRSHLDEIAQRSEHAKRTAKNFLSLETAPVTLGVMCTIGPLRFIGFLNAFRERYPGIEVTVIEGAADHLSDLLLEGKLDIALLARPQPFDHRLKAELVYTERFGLAFSTGHPFETRNTLQLSDVRSEPYLERINCEYGNHIDALCQNLGFEIKSAYRSEREDWILAMVAAGMGVCFIAEFSASQPGVCHRLVVDPEIVREVSLVSVAERSPSPAIAAFAKAVMEYDWQMALDAKDPSGL
ncbi:LysR family transcriptional regulator [Mesorhizobium loti]|uniref:LysR family transcriptional regulator n=1 Tax=Mesorhizobium jarvisii TaxID=1777867 RepID=A0A6M7TED6_9HYPH|nr:MULTISPECIES: LysR family transcriptional regulator [Mesorhizobium]OBQ75580.1 transcriptional regulator [Mesorhizobium loti]QKC63059.1 LysR family transcriptional regulator [Mesorhizobium jarvisii]QKD08970.1 LysR family transcriptional regulator [Mesorhizobium loti]RJT29963.1 LysR family transcriptional regulator [Mesorhizobium jarvisii]